MHHLKDLRRFCAGLKLLLGFDEVAQGHVCCILVLSVAHGSELPLTIVPEYAGYVLNYNYRLPV